MPRGIARVDGNQPELVDLLRRCGCRVEILSRLGQGCPDLLVGTPRGKLVLIEIKDPRQKPSARRLTPDEQRWHEHWRRYPIFIVETPNQALDAVNHDCVSFDVDKLGRKTCSGCHRELAA